MCSDDINWFSFIVVKCIAKQEAFVDPSVNGTLSVLKSCSRSPSVKRVVLTSSCSAIRYNYNTQELSPLDESHWSNLEYCKQYNVSINTLL